MGLTNALGRYVVPRGRENLPAWGELRRGTYEAWYLTFNLPAQGVAFWLRYTTDAPDRGEPSAALWGHFFDGRTPKASFGMRRRFDPASLTLGGDGLIRIGEAFLAEGRAVGALEAEGHALSWDVSFPPAATAVFIAPAMLRPMVARRATDWCVPNLDVRLSGQVIADGKPYELRGAPGQQAHLSGRRHAESWAWLHCNSFDGDRRAAIEGLCATLVLPGGLRRTITSIYLHHGGRDYLCQALPASLRSSGERSFPEWRFSCRSDGAELVGRVIGDPAKMLQVGYEDPDGEGRFCCNSELGDLQLEIRRRGGVELLTATGTAHLEFGGRERNPAVPLCPEVR